jgi:phosphatidylserine/phosphatidylglycerophosphate/cardiolipin synthase-like enzyme
LSVQSGWVEACASSVPDCKSFRHREDDHRELLRRDRDNRIAVGSVLGGDVLERWVRERTVPGLNGHVKYVPTMYLLIDPLDPAPLVITGSANFSDASTRDNDENLLVIRGDTRVADIHLGEFMRLFNHFYFRTAALRGRNSTHERNRGSGHPLRYAAAASGPHKPHRSDRLLASWRTMCRGASRERPVESTMTSPGGQSARPKA